MCKQSQRTMRNHRHDQTQVLQPCQTHLRIRKGGTQHSILRLLTLLKDFCHRRRIVAGSSHRTRPSRWTLECIATRDFTSTKNYNTNLSNNQLTRLPANLGTALPQTPVDLRWNLFREPLRKSRKHSTQ